MAYLSRFNSVAVLTTKNPEAFLNIIHIPDVSVETQYWIIPQIEPSTVLSRGILYVNGLDVNDYLGTPSLGYALQCNSTNDIASFYLYSPINYNFDVSLNFYVYDNSSLSPVDSSEHITIKNRPYIIDKGEVNLFTNDDILVDDEASYMLLRTNPKYTGNIVLYVDCSENMYLDTFKVSDILSNKKYRHQQVSGNSVLSSDIRRTFSTLPLGELYRVDVDNTLLVAIPKTELKNQFITTYNYGAKLLKDELYVEDNGVLAPLWINSKLPDYFALFRLDGVYNEETYDSTSLSDLAFKYLEESDLIRSWSLKSESVLGKYLNTHLTDLVKIQAPLFLSLTDPSANEADPNTWYGIAVDKGVLTGRSETTYFFNQKSENYTDLNAFVSQGFERNTLLCPNIVNMQFIFSDEDVSLYTMHRYFGFYLTENVLYKVGYYSDSSSGSIEIISFDEKDSSVFINSALFDSSGNIVDTYKNRIFVLNDEIQLKRITNKNQINGTLCNEHTSEPYDNIFSVEAEKVDINPFVILTLNNALEQGEHLRIVNKTQNKIWEIYSVDSSAFSCDRYCTVSIDPSGTHPTVYRTYFDVNGDISYQVQEIKEAFNLFGDYSGTAFSSPLYGDNWVSLILNDNAETSEDWLFQRISATTLNDFSDPSSGFNNVASSTDITFFGRFTPNSSDFEVISHDSSYGPIDFEIFGNRQSIMISFFNQNTNYLYTFDSSQDVIDRFETPTLYQGSDSWYRRILNFDVSNNSYQYIKDPLSIEDKIMILTSEQIQLVNGYFNAYNLYPLNISLMGINPVKDIDYTVYDLSLGFQSDYNYNREGDADTYKIHIEADSSTLITIKGSYVIDGGTGTIYQNDSSTSYINLSLMNTFDSSIFLVADTSTTITYAIITGTYNYKGYKDGSSQVSEERIEDYYDSSILLKYGLTVPLISKWVGLGNDCRNNPFRLMLNTNGLEVSTNFIPDADNFTQEISYPVFKYLSPGTRNWQDYVFYDINDVIHDVDSSAFITFKDAMFSYPYEDYFSKLVYSNYNVDATKTRSSIVYYNQYKNTLDVIFMGLNLSIKLENVAKTILDIKNYDRYRFSFISTPSRNKDAKRPIDFIINENTKTILMVWYQGNDELNYNKRYSPYLPGKSLLDPSSNGFKTLASGSSQYCFVKTPFFINNSTIQKTVENFYGIDSMYSDILVQPYAQFNKNLNGFNSIWNAFGNNTMSSGIFYVDSNKNYETFAQYVDYIYAQNANTYGDYVLNYGYNYNNNLNYYTNNTTNYDSLIYYLSTSYNYVMYYIIRGDEIFNSFDFGSNLNPFSITINTPRKYKNATTYSGWYKPKFNNILEFKANEESDLISTVKRDFTFSNTNLRSYNNIPQLWYNKVVSNVTSSDVSSGKAISYITDFNVFKSLWDASYYIRNNSYVNGYECSQELPSFFGSKLPKFPNQITLEKWDTTMASYSRSTTEIKFSFNLTRAILSLFKTNSTFLANWSNFSNSDTAFDNYVKDTVLTYYNVSQPKILVDYYYKSYDNQLLHYTINSSTGSFIKNTKQNFNGQLEYKNDEYIYNMIVPIRGNYSYFVSFTLTEK